MDETRIGRQTPTESFVLSYQKTSGKEAIELYEKTGRHALEWQKLLIYDMLARNDDSDWTHMSFGYALPRQNGKNEVVAIREMYGLVHGERILHTAHLTSTAHAAWERLVTLLTDAGLINPGKKDKGLYRANGKEHVYLDSYQQGGGRIEFRTRTSKGGLGESYDLGFVTENPTSAEAIKASHETLRLTARKAQRTFGSGFLNAGYLAACLRDDYSFNRSAVFQTTPRWAPIFEPDAAQMSGIGDAVIKINQAVPGYVDKDSLERMTGIKPGAASDETMAITAYGHE